VVNLSVKIGKLKLQNPVMVASGTFGAEYGELVDIDKLGAIVLKTVTLLPRSGNPPPRIMETASGMLNSIGLENKGIDDFIKNKIPALNKCKTVVIASIAGSNEAEYIKLTKRLDAVKRIDALEINLSCPNIRHGDREDLIAQDAEATRAIIKGVRAGTAKTIIAKLAPNVTDIAKIAGAAEDAGADAVLIANTFFGMAIDIETKRPKLGNITGGLSGPAIKPLVLHMVAQAYKKIRIPIIGCGGITDYEDALEFILAGASAVQIGTANFVNPGVAAETIDGIKEYMIKNKIANLNDLVGALKI